jgi:EpsD family peptidyl-prolyl cis-trans isomerase
MPGPLVRFAAISLLAFSLLTVQGCTKQKPAANSKESAVAAKVNGDEITTGQIDYIVRKLGNLPQDRAKDIDEQALATLINRQLLAQKAIADKLDSNPNVAQAIDAARNQILAEAYIQSKTENLAKPTDAEITDFYNKHPELFSDRRIYQIQEITIQGGTDNADKIRAQLAAHKNLDEFGKWLKQQNYKFAARQLQSPAEQLPDAISKRLMRLMPGQAVVINSNGNLIIMVVAAVASQPISAEQAKPAIEKILIAQKRREFAESEIESLRSAAKIEYMGEFADMGKAPKQPAGPAENAAQPASSAAGNMPANPVSSDGNAAKPAPADSK